jgi:hypothetical protein
VEYLRTKSPEALEVLKVVACFPHGAFQRDLDFLVSDLGLDGETTTASLNILTDANSSEAGKSEWLLSPTDYPKLGETRYRAVKSVRQYFNENPGQIEDKYMATSLRYLACLARGLLIALIKSRNVELKFTEFTAAFN